MTQQRWLNNRIIALQKPWLWRSTLDQENDLIQLAEELSHREFKTTPKDSNAGRNVVQAKCVKSVFLTVGQARLLDHCHEQLCGMQDAHSVSFSFASWVCFVPVTLFRKQRFIVVRNYVTFRCTGNIEMSKRCIPCCSHACELGTLQKTKNDPFIRISGELRT